MRIRISIRLDVCHRSDRLKQTSAAIRAARPDSLFQFQIVAAFKLSAAVDRDHRAAVRKQEHCVCSAALCKAEQFAISLIVPIVLDLVVLVPLLRPVEARGGEFLAVRDKQKLDFQLNADLTGDGELCACACSGVARRQKQEVDVRSDSSVNTELQRYDGKVKAESRKRLDRYAERGVKEHCAGCALIAECHFKVGVEADLKRDERGVRAAEERLSPLVLAFYICTDVTAAESDFPLAVRNACARFEDDRSVEVEFHRAFAVGIAVLLLAGIFKLFCEFVHIFGKIVCVEIDGNAVVIVFRTLI